MSKPCFGDVNTIHAWEKLLETAKRAKGTTSVEKKDKTRIDSLVLKIATERVKICFIDYRTLISLHEFSSTIETEHNEKDLKVLKRLFLENLFESAPFISEELFDIALSSALDRYYFELQEPHIRERPSVRHPRAILNERRLQSLEKLLEEILFEIRALREELHEG